jgi:glycosyltransferase involved in cell wall biosynthesis
MVQDLLITVFVPVYNGEKYLNETLTSIKNQTYTNIEVLLVDDSSTDGSTTILNAFADTDARFKVFTKKNGGMVSVSWNFIKPEIKGEYVFYSSQDDIFSIDLIEKMVQKQQETNADSILPDMEYYYENKENNKKIIGLEGNREIVLSGKEACVASLDWTIHGFPLTRTNLIVDEYFFEDAFDTDELITRKLFFKSNKVVFFEGIFYYRVDNTDANNQTFSTKNFYTLNTCIRLFTYLHDNNLDKKNILKAQYWVLNRYLFFSTQLKLYRFANEEEKDIIALFLSDFKKNQLSKAFYFKNLVHAILYCKLKYLLLWIVCQVPFLFSIVNAVHAKKTK